MISRDRRLMLAVAFAAALVMLLVLGTTVFAGASTTDSTICVDGYVINHREVAVDGSKVDLVVEAVGASGTFSATVDAKGYFKFEDLPAGDWNFRMQLPDGWEGIVPEGGRAALIELGTTSFDASEKCYRIVFKIRRLFDIIVIKWEELLDGTVRPGEDWTIVATPIKDPFVDSQTEVTDAGGQAGFTLTPGHWVIGEKVKSGWQPVTPAKVDLYLDQYAPPGAMEPVVFKNRQPACKSEIIVQKIGFGTDANGADVQLGPLAGWKVTVGRADKLAPPITKVTDAMGKATFGGLKPGVYKVSEQVQPGWKVIGDNPQTVVHVDCESTLVTFQNKETTGELTIYGRKLFKAWVPPYKGHLVGLAGWEITATLVGTDTYTSTVTNALGQYEFTEAQLKAAGVGFPGATVEVCEEERDNWIPKTPKCVKVTFPYPVPVDYPGAKVDFINMQDPPPGAVGVTGTGAPAAACSVSHVVARGQTLGTIAAHYGTSIGAIARTNGIRNIDLIYIGQRLCIR